MKYLSKNEDLISKYLSKNSLLNSTVTIINIQNTDEGLVIDIHFKLLHFENFNKIVLKFIGVEKFSFYWDKDYSFYNVEIFKLFIINSRVYLSLDPVEEGDIISDEDQDIILCKELEGYFES